MFNFEKLFKGFLSKNGAEKFFIVVPAAGRNDKFRLQTTSVGGSNNDSLKVACFMQVSIRFLKKVTFRSLKKMSDHTKK